MIFESFHGSPGTPFDFSLLESGIEGQWIHHDRTSHPQSLQNTSVLVGYSWGCRELFRKLASEPSAPRKIILIAPYMYTQEPSRVLRALLRTPWLSNKLLQHLAPKAIGKFITSSSYPEAPSPEYLSQQQSLSTPMTLKSALLEKDDFQFPELASGSELLLLWAEKDQTSDWNSQVEPWFQKNQENVVKTVIPGAGHALPWNKSHQVIQSIKKFLDTTKEVF